MAVHRENNANRTDLEFDSWIDDLKNELNVQFFDPPFQPGGQRGQDSWDFPLFSRDDRTIKFQHVGDEEFHQKLNAGNAFYKCEQHKLIKTKCPCPCKVEFTKCSKCGTIFCGSDCPTQKAGAGAVGVAGRLAKRNSAKFQTEPAVGIAVASNSVNLVSTKSESSRAFAGNLGMAKSKSLGRGIRSVKFNLVANGNNDRLLETAIIEEDSQSQPVEQTATNLLSKGRGRGRGIVNKSTLCNSTAL